MISKIKFIRRVEYFMELYSLSQKEAYELTDQLNEREEGQRRYSSYDSFRSSKSQDKKRRNKALTF